MAVLERRLPSTVVFLDRFHCNRQTLIECMIHSKMAARLRLHTIVTPCIPPRRCGLMLGIELVRDPHKRERTGRVHGGAVTDRVYMTCTCRADSLSQYHALISYLNSESVPDR